MVKRIKKLPLAGGLVAAGLARMLEAPRPCGWEVASARWHYDEVGSGGGVDATRYGDWEYSGRCTDF